ncbi:hypothetical protein [Legionella tunisiensis]|uniref:hypothetical protein n=1 Tax=Legionella tunisiensis TaxID=1034944 RepID=UPI0012EAE681|nr:hypothetical protein [Legionella tunisiensis]
MAINKSLAAEGKNLVFFVNNIGSVFSQSSRRESKFLRDYDDLVEDIQIDARLKKLGVSKIIIDSKDGIREIDISHSNSRKIYIITDCRIENDLAYKSIYGIAQTIAGCSGDNTLEEVLSRGLLPFFNYPLKSKSPV